MTGKGSKGRYEFPEAHGRTAPLRCACPDRRIPPHARYARHSAADRGAEPGNHLGAHRDGYACTTVRLCATPSERPPHSAVSTAPRTRSGRRPHVRGPGRPRRRRTDEPGLPAAVGRRGHRLRTGPDPPRARRGIPLRSALRSALRRRRRNRRRRRYRRRRRSYRAPRQRTGARPLLSDLSPLGHPSRINASTKSRNPELGMPRLAYAPAAPGPKAPLRRTH